MDWNFSFGWFILGLFIFVGGALIVLFYQPICDNMASGPSSYQKMKFWGVVIAAVGFLVMANLHTLVLSMLVKLAFNR